MYKLHGIHAIHQAQVLFTALKTKFYYLPGSSGRVKRESGLAARISGAVGKQQSSPFVLNPYNVNYSDCGILGFYISADSKDIDKVVNAAAAEIAEVASGKITDAEVKNGIQRLKV